MRRACAETTLLNLHTVMKLRTQYKAHALPPFDWNTLSKIMLSDIGWTYAHHLYVAWDVRMLANAYELQGGGV